MDTNCASVDACHAPGRPGRVAAQGTSSSGMFGNRTTGSGISPGTSSAFGSNSPLSNLGQNRPGFHHSMNSANGVGGQARQARQLHRRQYGSDGPAELRRRGPSQHYRLGNSAPAAWAAWVEWAWVAVAWDLAWGQSSDGAWRKAALGATTRSHATGADHLDLADSTGRGRGAGSRSVRRLRNTWGHCRPCIGRPLPRWRCRAGRRSCGGWWRRSTIAT